MITVAFQKRSERPHGQGFMTYDSVNALYRENINPQAAPDPVRYGATPSRAAKMPIAVMAAPNTWNGGFAEDFAPYGNGHLLAARHAAGHMNVGRQSPVGIRPNIERPQVQAYGSMFSLGSQTYDLERQ